jgi:hypothetical protein
MEASLSNMARDPQPPGTSSTGGVRAAEGQVGSRFDAVKADLTERGGVMSRRLMRVMLIIGGLRER